jgi:5-(carboxyamino)imidazole ribonucleotide synthase
VEGFYQNFTLGVLGGGQLGRMLIQSAIDFNIDVHVLDPDKNAPCQHIARQFSIGALTNADAVYRFGKQCDLLTIEIENVNTEVLEKLQQEGIPVFPQPEIIRLIQDKRAQKQFYKENNIPTADFVLTASKQDLYALEDMLPAVQKLGKAGYDGRGVQVIRSKADFDKGFDAPGLLERFVDFDKEVSVIVARNKAGEIRHFPVVELVFHPEHNLVEFLFAPADINAHIEQEAVKVAKKVIKTLDMIGLLAVEMFVTKQGEVLVNEIAPRTHNSGHHTIEANFTSQFEQHLRAILNMPLGATTTKIPAAMVNLLGEDGYTGLAKYEGLENVLALEGIKVHLYGKKLTKPFRKMGHITILDEDITRLKERARFVKENLKVIA